MTKETAGGRGSIRSFAEKRIYSIIKKKPILLYIFHYFIFRFARLQFQIRFFLFGRINIFKIQFMITTRCSLKCKDCVSLCHLVKNDQHISMSFEDIKLYLSNLLNAADGIEIFDLVGGEPLVHKDFNKILDYVLGIKKIKRVIITSNATIMFSDETVSLLKKYPQKTLVVLSDYSQNPELKDKLKLKEIIAELQNNNIAVCCEKRHMWFPIFPVEKHNRSAKENKRYLYKCSNICSSVLDGKWYSCNRAGMFKLLGFSRDLESGKDYLDISNPVEKKELVNFVLKPGSKACDFCSYVEERTCGKSVMPAVQVKS
jgi:organic radical activating enzyme